MTKLIIVHRIPRKFTPQTRFAINSYKIMNTNQIQGVGAAGRAELNVNSMRDESLRLLRSEQASQDPSMLRAALQAIMDAVRRLVDAICRALRLKGPPIARHAITDEESVAKQAQAINTRLAEVQQVVPTDKLHEALVRCGFTELQRSLLLQMRHAASLDAQALARLSVPVFETSAKRLAELDLLINQQRQELAVTAAPLVQAFGGPPLLVEDVVRICRQAPAAERPAEHAQLMETLLKMDDGIRGSAQLRETVSQAVEEFTRASLVEGVDLSSLDARARLILGDGWQDRLGPSTTPVVKSVSDMESAAAAPAAPSEAVLTAAQRLRAMASRMSSQPDEFPEPADSWHDADDHEHEPQIVHNEQLHADSVGV